MATPELLDAVRDLPLQVRDAAVAASDVDGLPDPEGITAVVILGVGVGRVAGDVVEAMAELQSTVPVIATGARCPAWVGASTLAVAVSPSGDEPATVAAADAAHGAGARVVGVTTGGELGEACARWGAPLVPVDPDAGPSATLGVAIVPVLVLLERIGLARGMSRTISGAAEQLEDRHRRLAADPDPVLSLSATLRGRVAMITGAGAIGKHAARRWVQEIDTVGGVAAVRRRLPTGAEDVATGRRLADATRGGVVVVALRHDHEPPGLDGGVALLDDAFEHVVEVRASGEGPLAQLLDLVLFADAVAAALRADTTP